MDVLVVTDLHWDLSPKEVTQLRQVNDVCGSCVCLGDNPLDQLRDVLTVICSYRVRVVILVRG